MYLPKVLENQKLWTLNLGKTSKKQKKRDYQAKKNYQIIPQREQFKRFFFLFIEKRVILFTNQNFTKITNKKSMWSIRVRLI